jgi:purine-cytosine permease-like protein
MVIGYVNFLVGVLIISGYLIIRNDLAFYKKEKMNKEQKVAKFLGYMNIVLGVFILGLNWVLDTWLG